MDIIAVMDEVAAQVDTIAGLRVSAFPPDSITPPAAVLDLPSEIRFDETFGRGMDRITMPLAVVVGKLDARSTRKHILPYFAGAGPKSIKQVVEAGTYTTFDFVRVMADDDPFEVWTIAGVAYLAGAFSLDIAGTGAP
jgi:hypothetical protein